MRALWEELDQFMLMPQCKCPNASCVCLAMRNARLFKIIQFLMGLNDQYPGVRSQVSLMGQQVPIIKKSFQY